MAKDKRSRFSTVRAIGEKGNIWLTMCARIVSSPKQPLGSLLRRRGEAMEVEGGDTYYFGVVYLAFR